MQLPRPSAPIPGEGGGSRGNEQGFDKSFATAVRGKRAVKLKAACGENSSGFTNKQSSQGGFFLARIAFSDDLLDQTSKFPLFPGDGGPLLQMTST